VDFGGGARNWIRRCLELSISGSATAARSLPGSNTTPEFSGEQVSSLTRCGLSQFCTPLLAMRVMTQSTPPQTASLLPTLWRSLITGAEAGPTSQKMALLLQRNLAALESATMTLAAILKQGIPQPGPSLTGSPVPGVPPAKLPAKSGAHTAPLPEEAALLPAT
jgi:hypothetical protein